MPSIQTINPSSVFDTLQYGFSQGVVVPTGKRILLSGQVGANEREETPYATLEEQTNLAFENIEKLLAEVGAKLTDIAFLRIYIVESVKNEQDKITKALIQHFPTHPPATSWLIVSGLSLPEWLIEIEAEAVIAG